MRSMSMTPKYQSVEPPEGDDEDEDLAKMDIPDIPPVIGKLIQPLEQATLNYMMKAVHSQASSIDRYQRILS